MRANPSRRTESRRARATIIAGALLVAFAWAAAPSYALAAAPSVVETLAGGASAWSYRDLYDTSEKYEGGYVAFDLTATAQYTADPHGGYNTTTNKCKVCHAVHRAESSYYLMRGESQADACVYCHVGSAHTSSLVYDGPGGMGAVAGHSIGAPSVIPASSTFQSLEESQVIASIDASGNVTTATVTVRRGDAARDRLFTLRRGHGQAVAGPGRFGYMRIGPVPLTCLSCHQVHNAVNEVWRPQRFPGRDATLSAGYKMLRAYPSGSIQGSDGMAYGDGGANGPSTVSYTTEGMRAFKSYTDLRSTGLVNADNVVRAPEATLTAETSVTPGTFGPGRTVWVSTPYPGLPPTDTVSATDERAAVDQYALSVWCADCHNLAIGSFGTGAVADLGMTSHEATSTHPVPMIGAGNGPGQCFTCHRGGLSAEPTSAAYSTSTAASCERCHYGTGSFAIDPMRTTAGGSDFPHSAESSAVAMLGAWAVQNGSVVATVVTDANVREAVCLRCHVDGGFTHETTPAAR